MNARILILLVPLVAVGCLDDHRRGGSLETSDATSDGDGAVDGGHDATTDGTDTIDPCAGLDCDDGDRCTDDWCTDGQCVHVPTNNDAGWMQPASECTTDAQCDDNDPCTTDACGSYVDECSGVAWSMCLYSVVPGCGGCSIDDCIDGDPCTLDGCDGASCTFHPIADPACSNRCNLALSRSVADITQTAGTGLPVIARGVVEMVPVACPDCDGCTCTSGAQLADASEPGGLALQLFSTPPATCTTTGGPAVCSPIHSGPRYLVWGTTEWAAIPFSAGRAAIPAQPTALVVEGFCLEPSADNLEGRYAATLTLGGEAELSFTLAIGSNSTGAPLMVFGSVVALGQRVDAARFEAQRLPVRLIDGRLEIDLAIPWRGRDEELVHVRLFSGGNGFAGGSYEIVAGEPGVSSGVVRVVAERIDGGPTIP